MNLRKEELKSKFRHWQKLHPNFMTPDVEKVVAKNNNILEISSGRKMFAKKDTDRMFGVTQLKFIGGAKTFENVLGKGKPFQTKKGADAYLKKLLKGL